MIQVTILDGDPDRLFETTLLDILNVISDCHGLRWSILEIDCVLKEESGRSAVDIENAVFESPTGWCLRWDDLMGLAGDFFQVLDGIFVGCEPSVEPPRWRDENAKIIDVSSIYIEMFDCGPWVVCLRDESLLSRFEERFENLEISQC